MNDSTNCKPSCCSPVQGPQIDALAQSFKAMGDPTRLSMLAMLRDCGDSLCACEIEQCFDLSQPTISHHLRLLKKAGLVESERRGSWMHFSISPTGVEAIETFVRELGAAAIVPRA